jgi:hypothetical protein
MSNIRLLVCHDCYDTPQQQLRAIVLPADPVPVDNPRIENFGAASEDARTVSGAIYGNTTDPNTGLPVPGNVQRVTSDSGNATSNVRVTQEIGASSRINAFPSLDPNAVMPLVGSKAYGVKLPVTSMVANGTAVITVTCSTNHNLSTGDQVSIEGSSLSTTDGFYSITVTSSTQFTYSVATLITNGSAILSPMTIVKTALVGVPRDMDQIPQTGKL